MLRSLALGHAAAALGAVLFASGSDGAGAVAVAIASLVVALFAARATAGRVRRTALVPLGVVAAVAACVLVAVTPSGVITLWIAALLGLGIGIASPELATPDRRYVIVGVVAGALEMTVCALIGGRIAALWCAAIIVIAVGVVSMTSGVPSDARRPLGRVGVALVTVTAVLTVALFSWVGANDPTVQWFGRVITHGDRSRPQVALTFDDGPDDPYTLDVSRILAEHNAKGTFFQVGKAIDARPDITRALLADGHLVANHSYHHDYWRWLDPRYPELDRTQQAFQRALGQCPAFFRPPHGQRTPFMLAQVRDEGMHAVTWDVSAQDWSERDGRVVAERIVDRARPGSIILLHDGLDGNVDADRSVLLTALPLIIDGLRAKGLEPVRLDELLGMSGYLERC